MKSRLDAIDNTILQVKTVVDDATIKSSCLDQDASSVAMQMMDYANSPARNDRSGDNTVHAFSHHLVNDQHYGTSSLASLFNEIEVQLEARLRNKDDSKGGDGSTSPIEAVRECQLAMYTTAKTLTYHDSLELGGEDLPPTLPPKEALEATVELYFEQMNCILPIFRKGAFCENIRRIYSSGPKQDDVAWILCFNNVILQTLSADSAHGRKQSDENHRKQKDSPERELLQPLLVNYRRGLKKLDRLLEPKLVNVQALLSMCMIALESFQYRLASLLLHQACFVAKSMGLHQQNAISFDQTSEKASEYNHSFWVLYIIDKTISLTMGQSCCLPMYDCDVSSPNHDPSSPVQEHFAARVEIAAMQEDSYQMLYSSQARRRGEFANSNSISQMDQRLALGASKHEDLREDIGNDNAAASPPQTMPSYASLALGYHFYMTRVLVHRAVKRQSDKRQCCNDARACIRLLQRLSVDKAPSACAVMSRHSYGDHPLVPFFVLFSNVIQEPRSEQSTQDVQLMATAAQILQHSQRFESSRACVAQLSACSQAITSFVSTVNGPGPLTSIISSPSSSEPLAINTDPFHTYTELAGRSKRNKLNATSRNSSWTNMSASARSNRAPTEYTPLSEQDLSRPENWSFDLANPAELVLPDGNLGLEYESPSSLTMNRTGLDNTAALFDEHQRPHLDHGQLDSAWSEDSGGYAMAMAPQFGAKWPMDFGPAYFGGEYAPRRTEQWLR